MPLPSLKLLKKKQRMQSKQQLEPRSLLPLKHKRKDSGVEDLREPEVDMSSQMLVPRKLNLHPKERFFKSNRKQKVWNY
jgi:hypothetical protein